MKPQVGSVLPTIGVDGSAIRVASKIISLLYESLGDTGWSARLWDGTAIGPEASVARWTLVVRRPGALRRMLLPPSELAMAEAYVYDDIDIEGDIEAAAGLIDRFIERPPTPARLAHLALLARQLPNDDAPRRPEMGDRSAFRASGRPHSPNRDAATIRFHYDLDQGFYSLFLDHRLVYSCAYFQTGAEELAAAQVAKLDYLCRKLHLASGERLLDIGCGWGGLIEYAARRYGVRAVGVTLSEGQAELARQRLAAAGLTDRCSIIAGDYRHLSESGQFDKIVSVGMIEHVGRVQLPTYFRTIARLVRPGGLVLCHGIVVLPSAPNPIAATVSQLLWRAGQFIQRYVFPDGELLLPSQWQLAAEGAGLELRDVENLREHYALTTRHWRRRLEDNHEAAATLVGESTYRVWRAYLAGSAHGFATGRMGLVQALFGRPNHQGRCELPLTRDTLYRPGLGSAEAAEDRPSA